VEKKTTFQPFRSAKPVWVKDRENEKNLAVGFRAILEYEGGQPVILKLAGSTVYRIWLNGRFIGYGPARAAHDHYRVDEWVLSSGTVDGANLLAIEVTGYNVNSYDLLDQPSFLQAEVTMGDRVLTATSGDETSFQALVLPDRVQCVQRYSYQRPFAEVYRLREGYDLWRRDFDATFVSEDLAVVEDKTLLSRHAPLPTFECRLPVARVVMGEVVKGDLPPEPWQDRSLTQIGPKLGGFPKGDLELVVSDDLQCLHDKNVRVLDEEEEAYIEMPLSKNAWEIVDFDTNLSGFIGLQVRCREPVRLQLLFDELLTGNNVDWLRMNTVNAVTYFLEPGDYALETIEPYTLRYLKILSLEGACEVSGIYLRELACPDVDDASFMCSDPELDEIYEAGRETFRQNAVDIFMDCPSRERAGWLCDSFFIGRVEKDLRGVSTIERGFLENFLLPEQFDNLPKGMLPMCYPADHPSGQFIPNWAMWFVLELEEYLARSGDHALASDFEDKVMALIKYLEGFANDEGLLESLESWVFIEWSKANDFVQDVNYPTNMLHAAMLDAAGRLYNKPDLSQRSEALRAVIREKSFDGEFFVDNAMREKGELVSTGNRTETCQYYAFYFDVATPDSHPTLWKKLVQDFGPGRQDGQHAEIFPSNAFIGYYLRLELLSRAGLCSRIVDELKGYFLNMARTTGTLWEHNDTSASCDHGFASHVVHVLYRDVLGVSVDEDAHVVTVRLNDVSLKHCMGMMPLKTGAAHVSWRKEGNAILCRTRAPEVYTVEVVNLTGMNLEWTEK